VLEVGLSGFRFAIAPARRRAIPGLLKTAAPPDHCLRLHGEIKRRDPSGRRPPRPSRRESEASQTVQDVRSIGSNLGAPIPTGDLTKEADNVPLLPFWDTL
jgi:hypothetical protein